MPPSPGSGLPADVAAVVVGVLVVVAVSLAWLARRAVSRARAELLSSERRALREHEKLEVAERELKLERERSAPEHRAERLVIEGIARSLRDLATCATRDDVAASLGRALQATLTPRQWIVLLAAGEAADEFVVAASGAAEGLRVWKPGARITGQAGIVGLAVRRRAPIDRKDIDSEPPIVREQVQRTEPADMVLDLAVPVTIGEKVTAVLAVGRPDPAPAVARTAAEALAQAASVVLRGLTARDRAERFANQDTLTGVGNRSWFNATAAEELYRIRQAGGIAAVVVIGVDHFQQYVRRNGHQAGDRLVRGIAQVIRPLAKETDLLARWSSDEFVAFLPDTDLPAAWSFATRVRRAVSQVDWPQAGEQPGGRVTLCAGIAAHPVTGADLETLIEAACGTLAEARVAGGDTTGSIVIEPTAARAIADAAERRERAAVPPR